MIGRADIEGSKSYVAMNAWQPQASYPCGNFSDTSSVKFLQEAKGSIGHAFTVRILTENSNQMSFCPFALRKVSVLSELILGHLCYPVADVPPQPNSPPDNVLSLDRRHRGWRVAPPPCVILLNSRNCGSPRISTQLSKQNIVRSSGISRSVSLPLMLHLRRHSAISD